MTQHTIPKGETTMPAATSSSRSTQTAPRRTASHSKPKLAVSSVCDEAPATENALPARPSLVEPATPVASLPPADPSESELIASLFSECDALDDLARAHGLSLRALIDWAERRDVLALRRSMRELADDRADLIVSRARTLAAHRLRTLVNSSSSEETSRKACIDLLRIRRSSAAAEPSAPTVEADPSDADEDDLLSRLDALALASNEPRHRATTAAHTDDDGPSGAD